LKLIEIDKLKFTNEKNRAYSMTTIMWELAC